MPSEARLNFFLKNNRKMYTRTSKSGHPGWILVATKFFQVAYHFSMIFIKFYKIPWYFQVFQVYSHFSRFSRSSGNPAGDPCAVRSKLNKSRVRSNAWWVQNNWQIDRQTDRHDWKHCLSVSSLAGGKNNSNSSRDQDWYRYNGYSTRWHWCLGAVKHLHTIRKKPFLSVSISVSVNVNVPLLFIVYYIWLPVFSIQLNQPTFNEPAHLINLLRVNLY